MPAFDPGTYALAALAVLLAGAGAAWIPARRSAAVDPATALRAE